MSTDSSIYDLIEKFREEYKHLLIQAVIEGLSFVSNAVASKKYIGTYYDYPSVSYGKNGLPSFSSNMFDPTKYTDCFSRNKTDMIINEDEIESFDKLIEFVEDRPDLNKRFSFTEKKGKVDDIHRYFIKSTIYDAIEWYVHKHNDFEFNEEKGNEIVEKILNYIFNKNLSIDIVIPILFIDFQFDQFQLDENIEIVRLDDQFQLARSKVTSYNVSVHQSVLASSTHGLLLKNWNVPNAEDMLKFDILSKVNAYPIDIINSFFGSLRVALNLDTGYAQILAKPQDWTHNQKTDLPDIFGATIRSYPSWFENYYWNIESLPSVSESDALTLKDIYKKMLDCEENSLHIAVRRLNTCLVRDREEDSVLDATIALEALFSDDENQEMTHKLAMRIAAISKLSSEFEITPEKLFKEIKSIYSYRSAIVHGNKKLDKKRLITVEEKKVTAQSLATKYLRLSIKVLLQNTVYLNPTEIDKKLLLGQ